MSDIKGKTPHVLGARVAGLRFTPEERFLMARIDGQLSVADLVAVTGIEAARVEQLVSKLAFAGAVELKEDPKLAIAELDIDDGGTSSFADFAAVLGMDTSAFATAEAKRTALAEKAHELTAGGAATRAPAAKDVAPTMTELEDVDNDAPTGELEEVTPDEAIDEFELVTDEEAIPLLEPETHEQAAALAKEDETSRAVAERNYRQLYQTRWRPLPLDQRISATRTAHGPDLLALCFDADPRVIAGVLENAAVGLDHVRLIAFYHRTGTGLELLTRRQDWLRDVLVERRLLRNPMVGEQVLARVMGPKRLFQTYKIAMDRDVPDISRVKCRGYLRKKWQTAASEERADLLSRTEARCLILMSGCTFDAKTTAILCGRPVTSVMFVQSVAKFGASSPGLLAHLIKQPFVRKNAPLKKMLLAHPNMPGEVKRGV